MARTRTRTRYRYFFLSRFVLRGRPKRILYYTLASEVWRFYRRISGADPEYVYGVGLRPGERLDVLATPPLPKRFQTRRWRRRLAAAALAELRAKG